MVGNMGMRRMVRFNGAPPGSVGNFNTFRGVAKAGKIAKRRPVNPIDALPKVSHAFKLPLGSKIVSKIKSMYPKSESRRIVASEIVNFLAKNPSAAQEDVISRVLSKFKKSNLKIDHSQVKNGKVIPLMKEVGFNSILEIYKDLIGPKGIILKTRLRP
ncbi:MAG: hypothetical protein WC821_04880 [archaeon]|jgi:hypothetical protein